MELKEIESAIEGVLFAAGEPVGVERICLALEIDKATAVTRAQSFKTCAALRAEAEGRLPKAVEFIVERIVKT